MSEVMIPSGMKAVVVRELGDPNVLKLETDFPTPALPLQPNQVLVKNEYAGLNFIDTYFRKGLYKKPLPFVAGQEGGGIIMKIGQGVENVAVGDKVAYMTSVTGAYAEYSAVDATKVVKVPEGVDLQTAVACMTQGLTAHYLTTSAHANLISKGEWMLIFSVGSGTCQWAARMAKICGYKVIGTTSKTKEEVAKGIGCDELIVLETAEGKSYADYNSVDIAKQVQKITDGAGCKCVIDGVGAATADISLECLARRGIWISFGNASGAVPPFELLKLSAKSAFVTRPTLAGYITTPEELSARCSDIFAWIKEGKLNVSVDAVFDLEEASKGHMYLESGKSKGKVLFKV